MSLTDFAETEVSTHESAPDGLNPEEVRQRAGLSRPDMARLLGMSEFGYGQWELGSRRPGGPAYRLLFLLNRDPGTTVEALRAAG